MNLLDGSPTQALTKQWTISNVLATLRDTSPEVYRATTAHLKAWCPKDDAAFSVATSSTWVPTRYMGTIANHSLSLLGEERFSAFWAQTAMRHFASGPGAGAFKVCSKLSTLGVMKMCGMLFGLACKKSGDIEISPGENERAATIRLLNIPSDLLLPGHFIGLGAVWKAVAEKAGARGVVVARTETPHTYTYRCTWSQQ